MAGLLLPVVALGGEWLARRWVVLGAIPVVLLAIALPSDVDLFRHVGALGNRDLVVGGCAFAAHPRAARGYPFFAFPTAPRRADRGLPAACRRRRAARRYPGVAQERLAADTAITLRQTGRAGRADAPSAR